MKTNKTISSILLVFIFCCFFSGCASKLYRSTPDAQLKGYIDVRWVENDYFLFIPNKENPFRLIRANGEVIQPDIMFTDGGSIPRLLWGVDGLSPWGHAPAYIAHDWLFEANRCDLDSEQKYTFDDSVDVLAEALKATMEKHPETRNYPIFNGIVAAVSTPVARQLWEQGVCKELPSGMQRGGGMGLLEDTEPPGVLMQTVGFD